jgi:hypothetical protein
MERTGETIGGKEDKDIGPEKDGADEEREQLHQPDFRFQMISLRRSLGFEKASLMTVAS